MGKKSDKSSESQFCRPSPSFILGDINHQATNAFHSVFLLSHSQMIKQD
jgi:hypothetical protein